MCGSRDIHRVNVSKMSKGVVVREVPVDECKNCGERYFDPYAMSMLSAATSKRRAG